MARPQWPKGTVPNGPWFAWGDTYEIDIADGVDEVMALSVVLIIDAVIDSQNSSSATVSSSSN